LLLASLSTLWFYLASGTLLGPENVAMSSFVASIYSRSLHIGTSLWPRTFGLVEGARSIYIYSREFPDGP
jgi:hypothetical protein